MDQRDDFHALIERSPTFGNAAASYLKHGGSKRYLQQVIDYFGDRPLATIYPFDVRQMALEFYPEASHSNATRNRCALTPARAVILHGYERGWCSLMRLRSFKVEKPKKKSPASTTWLHLFVRQCDRDKLPHLAACVLFMTYTGARVSEAVELRWSEVDLKARKALLLKTKTERNSERFLTDDLVERLYKLEVGRQPQDRVFRYKSRWSVNDRILAVCERADIGYKSSHVCGRHSFATNSISFGMDIKSAMEAGGWKSAQVFIETYVHAKHAGRRVAEAFNNHAQDGEV